MGRSSTINHVNGTETTTYSVANGAIKGGPYADVGAKGLAYGPDNTVWFGAYGFFHKFDGKEWTNYTCPASNFGNLYYIRFAFDSNGTMWVAGKDRQKNATFGEFDPVKGEQTPVACDFADDGVNSMFVDANDNVWIGTDYKGFYKYDGSTFVNYNKDSEANIDINIKTNATVGLCQATNGDIYYAFNKSLVCFSGDYMVVAGTVTNEDHPHDAITAAFANCNSLKSIYALNPQGIGIKGKPFEEYTQSQCTLYVPEGSMYNYQYWEEWYAFNHIVEFSPNGHKRSTLCR